MDAKQESSTDCPVVESRDVKEVMLVATKKKAPAKKKAAAKKKK